MVVELWFVARGHDYEGEDLSSLQVFLSREAAESYVESQEQYVGTYYEIESRQVDVSGAVVVGE